MEISVVVPLANEEENIIIFYQRIKKTLETMAKDYEIIFIDDGSTDGTFSMIVFLFEKDDRIKIVRFKKRFGQTAALAAGINLSQGEVIVTLDGDLQHLPEDIPQFVEKVKEGYDVVCGWRESRKDNLLSRKIPSYLGNKLIRYIFKSKLHDFGCTYRGYRKEIIKKVRLHNQWHRFLPVLFSATAKIAEIKIASPKRIYEKSKYSLLRISPFLFDLFSIYIFEKKNLWQIYHRRRKLIIATTLFLWTLSIIVLIGQRLFFLSVMMGVLLVLLGGGFFYLKKKYYCLIASPLYEIVEIKEKVLNK